MDIAFQDISLSFGNRMLLKAFSGEIADKDKMVFCGPSGSGKTTLLHLLAGFVKPLEGKVMIGGFPLQQFGVARFRSMIAYLPQEIHFNNMRVKEFIMMPFSFKQNRPLKPDEEAIDQVFGKLGLDASMLDMDMQEISGGEKQRVGLASCLLLKRSILILDEPTSALDSENKQKMMNELFSLKDLTIISSSHDPDWVSRCNKVISLKNNQHG